MATSELLGAVRKAKDVKDPAKLERIAAVFAKLDDDKDGKIEVDDLVKVKKEPYYNLNLKTYLFLFLYNFYSFEKVIDVVGREHVDLSSKQLEDIVGMLAKEELLEEKEKVKMAESNK